MRRTIRFLGVAGIWCGILLLLGSTARAGTASGSWEKGDVGRGETVYNQTCVVCHGADGKGAIPGTPDLGTRLSQPDDVLFEHVEDGFQSPGSPLAMPARGGNPALGDQELIDAICYMRSKFGGGETVASACPR